ncbi:MAG: DJ-1/PfpI family protein [Candidatus Omnitrophota bacterium]
MNKAGYKNEAVVIDGNVITSQGPATAFAFALSITEKLCGKEIAQRVKKETLASR